MESIGSPALSGPGNGPGGIATSRYHLLKIAAGYDELAKRAHDARQATKTQEGETEQVNCCAGEE